MAYQQTAYEVYRYSLEGVEEELSRGAIPQFEDAVPTKYDRFFSVAEQMGILASFEQLTDLRKNPAVPVTAVCVLMICRFLRSMNSFREMGELLLRYQPLLARIGFSARACENGVHQCKRVRDDETPVPKVFDEEVFSRVLAQLKQDELLEVITAFVKTLRIKHPSLFKKGVFIMDSNHFRLKGNRQEHKWCAMMLQTPYGMIPVAMEFSATMGEGTGETSVGRRLLEHVVRSYGPGFMRVVLMDAGYIDGETLCWLKNECGVDWVTRSKESMRASQYMAGEASRAPNWQWHAVKPPQLGHPTSQLPTRKILWVENVPRLPGYGSNLNGCLLKDTYPASQEKPLGYVVEQYLIASNPEWKGNQIHSHWRERWEIENAFGYMTDNWGLGTWEIGKLAVYQATIILMALTYGMHILMQKLVEKPQTLRQLKYAFELQSYNMIIIRAGDSCAIITSKTLNNWLMRGILALRAP